MKIFLNICLVILLVHYLWTAQAIGAAVTFGVMILLQQLDVQIHNHHDDDWQ